MHSSSVVLLQSDPGITQSLAADLRYSFRSVKETRSLKELRTSIAKHRPEVAILDMEIASISEVGLLAHEFPSVSIVCTHRLADEEMWAAALNAGAADICPSQDKRGILTAVMRSALRAQSLAA
jgi:DNA-binding NarL/FixJ family response regulator